MERSATQWRLSTEWTTRCRNLFRSGCNAEIPTEIQACVSCAVTRMQTWRLRNGTHRKGECIDLLFTIYLSLYPSVYLCLVNPVSLPLHRRHSSEKAPACNDVILIAKFIPQVITIFSASNYYEIGSNKGAYLKLNPQLDTHFVQYTAAASKTRKLTFRQRIGLVESSALRELGARLRERGNELEREFAARDPNNTS